MPVIDQWFTVATAGETVDGRVIEEQWLRDMAETYSVDFYQAVIDADHNLGYGSFGEVEELRIGEKVGRVALQAKINANPRLLEMNKNGQRLFFSIWPKENFSDTGKTYLYRLAITNNPASIGTDKMKFSCGEKPVLGTPHLFEYEQPGTGNEPEKKIAPPPPAGAVPTEESRFSVLRNFFTGKPEKETDKNTPDDQPQDDDTMNEEQFAAFMQQQKEAAADQLAAIKDLGKKFSATANDGTPGDENTDTQADAEDTAETVSVEKFNTLQEELDDLKTKFAAALEEQPGTPQGDHDGSHGDAEEIL